MFGSSLQSSSSTPNKLFSFSTPSTTQQSTSLFGQSQAQPQQQSTGLFGQPQSTNLFGQSQTQPQAQSAGLFGQTQPQAQSTGLFGQTQPQNQAQPQSTSLFGQSQLQSQPQTQATSLFGQSQPQQQSTNLFGQPQAQQQPQSTSLFGQSQSQPQPQPQQQSTGLFSQPTQQQPSSLFGSNLFGQSQQQPTTSIFGQSQQQPTTSLFGQSQLQPTTSLFGQSQQQPAKGLFGQSQPQQQQPVKSLFGQSQPQQQQSSSLFGQSQPLQQSLQGSVIDPAQAAIVNPALPSQISRIQSAWDRSSPACEFQYYFYNRVPREEAALYVKPPNEDQKRWDEAIAKRPDDSLVPVLAVGFEDVARRMASQKQQVFAYRTRMHEIANKLSELASKNDLSTVTKVHEAQIKHLDITKRILKLAIRLQIIRMRGYALTPDEELLRVRVDRLAAQLKDPSTFGRMHELWARMVYVREQIKKLEHEGVSLDSDLTISQLDQQLGAVLKALQDQHKTISYVTKLLLDDEKVLENIKKRDQNDEPQDRSLITLTPSKE